MPDADLQRFVNEHAAEVENVNVAEVVIRTVSRKFQFSKV